MFHLSFFALKGSELFYAWEIKRDNGGDTTSSAGAAI